MFIMCKQLNGQVLKPLKPKLSGLKLEKKNCLFWPMPKYCILFQTRPGLKYLFLLQAWAEIADIQARSGPEKFGSCRPLKCNQIDHKKSPGLIISMKKT